MPKSFRRGDKLAGGNLLAQSRVLDQEAGGELGLELSTDCNRILNAAVTDDVENTVHSDDTETKRSPDISAGSSRPRKRENAEIRGNFF